MPDISSIPTAELPALVEQGMPVADYIAEIERRKAEAMADLTHEELVERVAKTLLKTGLVVKPRAYPAGYTLKGFMDARARSLARAALFTLSPPATDPVMAAFHEPRDLDNGAAPYTPTEEA